MLFDHEGAKKTLAAYRAKNTADIEIVQMCDRLLEERKKKDDKRNAPPTPSCIKVCWMMFAIALVSTIIISLISWHGMWCSVAVIGFGVVLIVLHYEADVKSGAMSK